MPARRIIEFSASPKLAGLLKNTPSSPAYLSKHLAGYSPKFHDDEFKEAYRKADGDRRTQWLLRLGTSRNSIHLARLGRLDHNTESKVAGFPPDVEKRFSIDVLRHARSALSEDKLEKVFDALCTEGLGVNHFWTFAPYLHHELLRMGRTPRESLKILLTWAHHSITPYNEELPLSNGLIGLEHADYDKVFELEGADPWKAEMRKSGGKSEYATHEMVARLAAEFAPVLLKAYGSQKRKKGK